MIFISIFVRNILFYLCLSCFSRLKYLVIVYKMSAFIRDGSGLGPGPGSAPSKKGKKGEERKTAGEAAAAC